MRYYRSSCFLVYLCLSSNCSIDLLMIVTSLGDRRTVSSKRPVAIGLMEISGWMKVRVC